MLCIKIIAVCSKIHTKPINSQCGQYREMLNDILTVHRVTTGFSW